MLALVIAGSVGWFVYTLASDPSAAPATAQRRDPGYVCYKCGGTFTLTQEDYATQVPDPAITEKHPSAVQRPHCPLCKAKHSGFMMVACPACGKSYLPPMTMPRGSKAVAETQDVCPHCKTDRAEALGKRAIE